MGNNFCTCYFFQDNYKNTVSLTGNSKSNSKKIFKDSLYSTEIIDKNNNKKEEMNNIKNEEYYFNNSNGNSNRNSSFSIMKVNAVPSIENRDIQELNNTINKKEMFNKLINGK
jgi:hypothetical protein